MWKNDDGQFIRERAEYYGLNISNADLAVLKEKWQSDPFCNLDDLLAGLRRLAEKNTAQMLAETNRMIQNSKVEREFKLEG